MKPALLPFALLILVYGAGASAQPRMEPPAPARAIPTPAEDPRRPARYDRSSRNVPEVFGGLAGGVVGALLGGAVGYGIAFRDGCDGDFCGLGAVVSFGVGAFTGMALGMPIGVTLAGRGLHGNGGFGWSLLGSLAGAAVVIPLAYAFSELDVPAAAIPVGIVLPLAGAIIGYELSSDADRDAPPQRPRRTALAPSLAASPNGVFAGVVGTF